MLTGMRTSPCLTVWKEKGIFDRSPRTPHNHGLRITPELDQRGGELGHLIVRVRARVPGVRLEAREWPLLDLLGAKAKGQGTLSLQHGGGNQCWGMADSRQASSEVDFASQPGVQPKSLLMKRKKPPGSDFWIGWLPEKWGWRYRGSGTSPPA
jgi:hypothetical protein